MIELIRTNDVVLLNFLQSFLKDSGIESLIFDTYSSSIEGSLGILPRRLMVPKGDLAEARTLLDEAGIQYDI